MRAYTKAKYFVYKSEAEVRAALTEFSLFICFLTVTTIIALSSQHSYMLFFIETIQRLFVSSFSNPDFRDLKFENIVTVPEWWLFLENNFLESFDFYFASQSAEIFPDEIKDTSTKDRKSKESYLLGVPKLRQIRVRNDSCNIHHVFKRFFKNCHDKYKYGNEDTSSEYKGTKYYHREAYKATPIHGELATYNGPGYMELLSYDKDDNLRLKKELQDINWIDAGTRLVVFEFLVYNVNTFLFCNVKFNSEILPSGGLRPTWSANMVPIYIIWSPNRPKILITAIIFYLLVIYYTSVEIQELFGKGFKAYFSSTQNYVDAIILITAFSALTLTMRHPFLINNYLEIILEDPKAEISFDEISFFYSTYVCFISICTFCVWLKIFRFISFNKTMLQFSATLRRCAADIIGFAIMFLIVFVAFALFGMLAFGAEHPDFINFSSAMFVMVRMVLGDFQYERFEKSNRILGPIFCVLYVLFITFILLNMFLAIINSTYIEIKQEITEEYSAIKTFVVKAWRNIASFWKDFWSKLTHKDDTMKNKAPSFSIASQPEDDDISVLKYTNVPFPTVPSLGSRSHIGMDDDDEDLMRLTERIELLENVLQHLSKSAKRVLSRIEKDEQTDGREQ